MSSLVTVDIDIDELKVLLKQNPTVFECYEICPEWAKDGKNATIRIHTIESGTKHVMFDTLKEAEKVFKELNSDKGD